jgi:hypothetical protein
MSTLHAHGVRYYTNPRLESASDVLGRWMAGMGYPSRTVAAVANVVVATGCVSDAVGPDGLLGYDEEIATEVFCGAPPEIPFDAECWGPALPAGDGGSPDAEGRTRWRSRRPVRPRCSTTA